MYPISSEAKALFDAEKRKILRITGIDPNGVAIYITDANVMENGFSIDRYCCNGSRLEIGTAVAAELTLKLDNRQGQFDDIVFEGAELFVEIGVANWNADPVDWTTNLDEIIVSSPSGEAIQFDIANAVYWIPCGYFTPDQQPRRLSTITLHALDRMMAFDLFIPALMPWTDNNGNTMTDNHLNTLFFNVALELPSTIQGVIEHVCRVCDVPLGTDLTVFPAHEYVMNALPEVQGDITFRNIIQWCAGLFGTNAYIDWNGRLCFSWYNNATGYTMTTQNRYSSDLYENDIRVTGVRFVDDDEVKTVYLAGTDDYVIDVSDNPLIDAENAQMVLNNIYNYVNGFAYRPFSATVVAAPYLWPMDRVTFTDKFGYGHVTLLTNVRFTLNGVTTLVANGETSQTNKSASPSGFTGTQRAALERIRRVNSRTLEEAISHATALITGADGGFVRFIYDENDVMTEIVIMDTDDIQTATKVWRWNRGGLGYSSNGYNGPYTTAITQDGQIVADFITTGLLDANLIRAGILTDNYGRNFWNLDTGEFRLSAVSTLGNRTVEEVLTAFDETITGVDIEYAQNQSMSVAPTSGWSTDAPTWAAGYYIWQRTKTTTPSGVEYSTPTCISGRDGESSAPGLNQATIYLYQRAATQPSKPNVAMTYTFATGELSNIPSGWSRGIPNGTSPCWVTSAVAISTETTDTIPANEWLTVTKLVEDGTAGASVASITDYFAVSNDTTPPADSAFWTPGVVVQWTDNNGNSMQTGTSSNIEFAPTAAPAPTEVDKYVWKYQVTIFEDGTTNKSNKYITAALGEEGVGISAIVEEYYLSTSQVSQVDGNWSTEQPVWSNGCYIWTRSKITWTDGKVTTTDPVLAKALNGANETADDALQAAWEAGEHADNLDAGLDQRGVFNRLTNNGEVQGIFLEGGRLYLNATYMKTGTLDASVVNVTNLNANNIKAGKIEKGNNFWNLSTGEFQIKGSSDSAAAIYVPAAGKAQINAGSITAGTLSADRIAANSITVAKLTGSISGGLSNSWSINLTDGTMTIGNISAANITTGTLSADRIAANSITVAKLTGSISNSGWVLNLTNGTFSIGNISAANITTGTLKVGNSGNSVQIEMRNGNDVLVGKWDKDAFSLYGSTSDMKLQSGKLYFNYHNISNSASIEAELISGGGSNYTGIKFSARDHSFYDGTNRLVNISSYGFQVDTQNIYLYADDDLIIGGDLSVKIGNDYYDADTDKVQFISDIQDNGSGIITRWYRYLNFKNGIFVGVTNS